MFVVDERGKILVHEGMTRREFLEMQASRWLGYGWKGSKAAHGNLVFENIKCWEKLCGMDGHVYKGIPVDVAAPIYEDGDTLLDKFHLSDAAYWAEARAPLLLSGETGTGKNLLVGLIPALTRESQTAGLTYNEGNEENEGNVVLVNLGAEQPHLLEGNLRGTIRGAFTGSENRKGYIERANGGILFLDQIESIEEAHQILLLTLIDPRGGTVRGERMGAGLDNQKDRKRESYNADVWWILATNRDPISLVKENILREDFYYRCPRSISLPNLQERIRNASSNGQKNYMERLVFFISEQVMPIFENSANVNSSQDLPFYIKERQELFKKGRPNPAGSFGVKLVSKHGLPGNLRQLASSIANHWLAFFRPEDHPDLRKHIELSLSISKRTKRRPQELPSFSGPMSFRDFIRMVHEEENGDQKAILNRLYGCVEQMRTLEKNLKPGGKWHDFIAN